MGIRQQGFLAELLGYPEEASTEVGCGWRVLREKGSQAQQARGLPQTLKVFRILRQPCAEHCTHRSAEIRREIFYFCFHILLPGLWGMSPFDLEIVQSLRTKRFLIVLYKYIKSSIIFKSIISFCWTPMKEGVIVGLGICFWFKPWAVAGCWK